MPKVKTNTYHTHIKRLACDALAVNTDMWVHADYRKNPKYSDIPKFALITLKFEHDGFTKE